MKCILIFDHLNDIIYSKYNRKFLRRVKKVARTQGLLAEEKDDDESDIKLSSNVLIQLFSPIITSQRIMSCQFGNSYTSIQCVDGANMVFEEYMGYIFINISSDDVAFMKRSLGICISIVQHLCGPDVSLLKQSKNQAALVSRLMDTWTELQDSDQAFLVEAVEQLMVNPDLSCATMKALQEATDKLKAKTDVGKVHAMVIVENKFLSLYSSRNAQDLLPSDIMFLSLLTEAFHLIPANMSLVESTESEENDESSEGEFYSPPASPSQVRKESGKTESDNEEDTSKVSGVVRSHTPSLAANDEVFGAGPEDVNSQLVLLGRPPTLTSYVVHVGLLAEGVYFLLLLEVGIPSVSSGLYETLYFLNALQSIQLQKDMINVRQAFDLLEGGMKKIFEGLKRNKSTKPQIEASQKKLQSKWDFIRRKYIDYIKTQELDCVLRIESSTASFNDCLRELFNLVCMDASHLVQHRDVIVPLIKMVKYRLSDFSNFLKVKALRNFTLGSRASLTINKYLEEFPGLVHFIYIDRINHRVTTPSLDFSSEETVTLTKKKIWSMVDFSRQHLHEGQVAIMWKDTTFNYVYFLWFEDSTGTPLKAKIFPTSSLRNFPMPGILCGDFYKKLIEECFPKMSPNKVRCYELYCIHLGLATSSCVLEHTRRLAATIWEVTGMPGNPIDLL